MPPTPNVTQHLQMAQPLLNQAKTQETLENEEQYNDQAQQGAAVSAIEPVAPKLRELLLPIR